MPRPLWIALAAAGGLLLLLVMWRGSLSDTAMRALIVGGWGVVVAAGIIGSGIRLGEFSRNLALWLAAIVVLVAGYQYRNELQDIASRITAGLVPGSPLSLTDGEGRVTVQLERLPNGHFDALASVNGKDVRFTVDTGATTTVLTSADARRAGYDPGSLQFTVPVMTANGQTSAAFATADTIAIGAIRRDRMPILIAAAGQLDQSLLGMNFIGSLSGFDMRGDRMILRD